MITMQVLGLDVLQKTVASLSSSLKFGASVGLNRTMDEAQSAIRETLPGRFTLRRRDFVEKTIYRKPGEDFASKDKLAAGVRIHDERNVLAKFEEGGDKTPRGGGVGGAGDSNKAVAIPVGARPSKTAVVPQRLQLKSLFFGSTSRISQAIQIISLGRRERRFRGLLVKRSGITDDVFVKDGKVFQKTGKRGKLKLLWIFKPSVRIQPLLHFVETAKRIVMERGVANIAGAMQIEAERGLTSKSGVTVK